MKLLKISNNVSYTYLTIVAKFQINSVIIFGPGRVKIQEHDAKRIKQFKTFNDRPDKIG